MSGSLIESSSCPSCLGRQEFRQLTKNTIKVSISLNMERFIEYTKNTIKVSIIFNIKRFIEYTKHTINISIILTHGAKTIKQRCFKGRWRGGEGNLPRFGYFLCLSRLASWRK
jgi:hypothetical protein